MALSVSEKLKFCWYCCRQVDPRPENSHLFYNFSQFTMGLNEMSPNYLGSDRILPPSDCRLRPDLRALENGDLEVAKTFNPFQNLDHSRCDHIGPFWIVNFSCKSSPNIWQIYGFFYNYTFFCKNSSTIRATFGRNLDTFYSNIWSHRSLGAFLISN